MTDSRRIIVNTLAQYTRTIVNVCLSLYSTRLILSALGQSDYGVYSVVAGVVAMLSFVTNAMVTTTQRYLSYNQGKNDTNRLRLIFANSMLLHVFIGLALMFLLFSIGYPIVYCWLNIIHERQDAAFVVYSIATVMLFISFTTSPLRSLFISRENIVYISIVDVLDGLLKLGFAFVLCYVSFDKLICYAVIMLCIQLVNFFAYAIYAASKFPECHFPRFKELDKTYIKELSSFTGWTVFSSGCVIARNQGIAIIFNMFCGVVVNAAYAIAQQVLGAVAFVSSSIVNAMNPQIMKAEGAGNRDKMIRLAEYESKYAFLLLAIVAIPLIVEMDSILSLWLTEVPTYTVPFCQLVLLAALCDQLTVGLTSANQAFGKIGVYTMCFYSIKLLTLVGVYTALRLDVPVQYVLWSYVGVELFDAFVRLPLLKWQIGISVRHFISHVLLRVVIPAFTISIVCLSVTHFITIPYRFVLTMLLSVVAGGSALWFTSLDKSEKMYVRTFAKRHE